MGRGGGEREGEGGRGRERGSKKDGLLATFFSLIFSLSLFYLVFIN